MTVPGSDYSSKYGQIDEENPEKSEEDQLYEKYDSPDSNSAAGEISESNSVSGMALQDRPTGNNPQVWEKFFRAGLYGSNVPSPSTSNKKVSDANFRDEERNSSTD